MLLQARSHFNKVIDSSSGSAEALVRMNLLLYITIPPGICHFVPPRREHWHGTELENTEWPRKAARRMPLCWKGKQTISQLARGKDSSVPWPSRDQMVVHFAGVGEMGSAGQGISSSIESQACCED